MNIISRHSYNGESLGKIKKIYKWDEDNPYDEIKIFKSEGNLDDYPVCAKILSGLDHEQLYNDYLCHQEHLLNRPGTYLKRWFRNRKIDWNTAKQELDDVNFIADEYKQFNIMGLEKDTRNYSQWSKILPWVEPYTKEVLDMFQSRVIRARYSVAYPGWHLKPHIDYPHPKTNGFRVHIPVFTNEKIRTYFLIDDEWCEIYFEPGHAWFMNVSVPHKIDHEGDFDRVYLTLDLWDDRDIPAEKQTQKINYLPERYK